MSRGEYRGTPSSSQRSGAGAAAAAATATPRKKKQSVGRSRLLDIVSLRFGDSSVGPASGEKYVYSFVCPFCGVFVPAVHFVSVNAKG